MIYAKPSNPSTMMTAAIEAMELTEWAGQAHTLVTSDHQLYKVLVDIKWDFPYKFKNLIPRVGGMYFVNVFY